MILFLAAEKPAPRHRKSWARFGNRSGKRSRNLRGPQGRVRPLQGRGRRFETCSAHQLTLRDFSPFSPNWRSCRLGENVAESP